MDALKYAVTMNLAPTAWIATDQFKRNGNPVMRKYNTYKANEQKELLYSFLKGSFVHDRLVTCFELTKSGMIHTHSLLETRKTIQELQEIQELAWETYVPRAKQYRTPLNCCLDVKLLETDKDVDKWMEYLNKTADKPELKGIFEIREEGNVKNVVIPAQRSSSPPVQEEDAQEERCYKCHKVIEDDSNYKVEMVHPNQDHNNAGICFFTCLKCD